MIEIMVEAGLVDRQISASDLRKREVMLTDKGRDLLKEITPTMEKLYGRLIQDIDERDLEVTANTLKRMLATLQIVTRE